MDKVSAAAVRDDVLASGASRASFLRGAAVAVAALGLAPGVASAATLGAGHVRASMPASVKSTLDIAATAEALAVTAFYNVHTQVLAGKFNTNGLKVPNQVLISVVRAILREEQDHYAFLVGAGAKPLVTSFTFSPYILTTGTTALRFVEQAETIFIAAYMAANREFAAARMDTLAQYAYQIGGTECEHRALARVALGELPPNDKSFETNRYQTVKDVADTLAKLGLLTPNTPYPGAMAVDRLLATTVTKDVTAGVIQRKP